MGEWSRVGSVLMVTGPGPGVGLALEPQWQGSGSAHRHFRQYNIPASTPPLSKLTLPPPHPPQALLEQSKATLRATFSSIMRKRVFTLSFDRCALPHPHLTHTTRAQIDYTPSLATCNPLPPPSPYRSAMAFHHFLRTAPSPRIPPDPMHPHLPGALPPTGPPSRSSGLPDPPVESSCAPHPQSRVCSSRPSRKWTCSETRGGGSTRPWR